jgi:hypothetical protein
MPQASKRCCLKFYGYYQQQVKWNMPARLIYLDQNKWIELARATAGKATPQLIQILDLLRESKRQGLNLFPLSLAHFIETNKRRDLKSRSRLGYR